MLSLPPLSSTSAQRVGSLFKHGTDDLFPLRHTRRLRRLPLSADAFALNAPRKPKQQPLSHENLDVQHQVVVPGIYARFTVNNIGSRQYSTTASGVARAGRQWRETTPLPRPLG